MMSEAKPILPGGKLGSIEPTEFILIITSGVVLDAAWIFALCSIE